MSISPEVMCIDLNMVIMRGLAFIYSVGFYIQSAGELAYFSLLILIC